MEDTKLYPIRGQAILVQSTEIREFLAVDDGAHIHELGDPASLLNGSPDKHSTPEGETTYIIPRSGIKHTNTVLLGGTFQSGNWDTSLDMDLARRIFDRCAELAPSLKDSQVTKILKHRVGLRPGREGGARVEVETVKFPLHSTHDLVPWDPAGPQGGSMQVVHAYGFG